MKCPSAAEIARRYVKYAPGRFERFQDGIRNPSKEWEKETKDAEPNYEEGVKKAIARKAFGKGVDACGTAGQQKATIEKGLVRWPEGIRIGEPKMKAGMEDVVKTLEATTLPPKYPKGDPRNIERVRAVAVALHKMKTG